MNKETLKTEKIDSSLLITFTRPDEMNTFSGKMMVEIMDTLDEAESDDSVRSVIFTGSGRAYCAGADLSQGEKTFDWSKRDKKVNGVARDTGGMLTLKLYDFKKPIIANILNDIYSMNRISLPFDSIGMIAGTLCAIHCIATPFLFLLVTILIVHLGYLCLFSRQNTHYSTVLDPQLTC